MVRRVVLAATTLSLVCVLGVASAADVDVGSEEQRAAGKAIYDKKCSQCHGDEGEGEGPGKDFFDPPPRDFTSGAFKVRTTPSGELPTTEDLKEIIRRGMPYTGMPAWPQFTDADLQNLAYYIKGFNEDFEDEDANIDPIAIPKAPPFSQDSAIKGRTVYDANQCVDCHGNSGRGDGESGPTLTDDADNPIRPADLTRKWTFRGGSERSDIYRTFTTGLDGTPMPSYADSIDEEDRWALVDYIYSLSPATRPEQSFVVVVHPIAGGIDLSTSDKLFAGVESAAFPVVGQVIEPGRCFQPMVNEVRIKAIASSTEVAVQLAWSDMTASTDGVNDPAAVVSEDDEDGDGDGEDDDEEFSDAVALQIPATALAGATKPGFLLGDTKNAVELWHVDMAGDAATMLEGRGAGRIKSRKGNLESRRDYADGEWTVTIKRARQSDEGIAFNDGDFVPFAVSLWEGTNHERGSRRGLTSWFHFFMKPLQEPSAAAPAAKAAGLMLFAELLIVFFIRRRARARSTAGA